ncbi:hypothetical protein [Paraglaciecola arctica]|uniref:hypothetical protein n=1 Tax=Paraglaciecola arctica TaxID=1128911 RepID=UPI001C067E7E|nr:hypothetical protein [Paraglaciecola arctica]MBU3005756.1 hypothetical protein [Paraglaciecola arctica]
MNDERLSPFVLNTNEGKFQVVDGNEQTWLESSNEMTAQHYADLLNKAFKSGFKTGFREARTG